MRILFNHGTPQPTALSHQGSRGHTLLGSAFPSNLEPLTSNLQNSAEAAQAKIGRHRGCPMSAHLQLNTKECKHHRA